MGRGEKHKEGARARLERPRKAAQMSTLGLKSQQGFLFPGAAIINYSKLGGLQQQKCILTVGDWKSQKCRQGCTPPKFLGDHAFLPLSMPSGWLMPWEHGGSHPFCPRQPSKPTQNCPLLSIPQALAPWTSLPTNWFLQPPLPQQFFVNEHMPTIRH